MGALVAQMVWAQKMNDLNETLKDISGHRYVATGQTESGDIDYLKVPPGPNKWSEITETDFGPEHDFEVDNHGTIFIFTPVSEAGKQWCYNHLPEDCPRWGILGFVVEHRYIADIVAGARRDGLMALEDYERSINEEQLQDQAKQAADDERETHGGCML